MLAKRIIPCLDVKDGMTVKGINFKGLQEVGDPVEMGVEYSRDGADELVYLDISASVEGRKTFTGIVSRIASRIHIPFTVGGGISSFEDAARLLDEGADKISVNSAAVRDPSLISRLASKYGSQFVVAAIDAKSFPGEGLIVMTHGGTRRTELELYEWARRVQDLGAGEILLTSMDHDGMRKGYPIEIYEKLSGMLSIPVIASGGAGSVDDIAEVLRPGRADAALAASLFHYGEITISELKRQLLEKGINVRI